MVFCSNQPSFYMRPSAEVSHSKFLRHYFRGPRVGLGRGVCRERMYIRDQSRSGPRRPSPHKEVEWFCQHVKARSIDFFLASGVQISARDSQKGLLNYGGPLGAKGVHHSQSRHAEHESGGLSWQKLGGSRPGPAVPDRGSSITLNQTSPCSVILGGFLRLTYLVVRSRLESRGGLDS
jgi:hypothetical protein